jgi:hypothetical protein
MARLHSLKHVTARIILLISLQCADAEDYCSLSVRVLSPDQQRPVEVAVKVQEQNGRSVTKETTVADLKFCDLGITPVTVTVGSDACNQVIVRDIPLEWDEEYQLTVIYDVASCMIEAPAPPVPVCRALFRISDYKGTWLNKAVVRFTKSRRQPLATDGSGRALLTLKAEDRMTGIVESPGYYGATFNLACSPLNPLQELRLQLQPIPQKERAPALR